MPTISSGTSTNLTISSGESYFVYSQGVVNSTTVNKGGLLDLYNGGRASNTTVNSGGTVKVSSFASAIINTVNDGGNLYVYQNAYVYSTTVNYGEMNVYSGGTAGKGLLVRTSGVVNVSKGGYASETTVSGGGIVNIYESGTVANSVYVNGGVVNVYSGGRLTGIEVNVNGGGVVNVSGGTANSVFVNPRGSMNVYSGGVANSTTLVSSGAMMVYSGGIANVVTADSSSFLYLWGGSAESATIGTGAGLMIYGGGSAYSATVDADAGLVVFSGGMAGYTKVRTGGEMYIYSSGYANGVTLSGGILGVRSDGEVESVTISDGGMATVSEGGWIRGAVVYDGGFLKLQSGACGSSLVDYGGDITVSGAEVEVLAVMGGTASVYDGGVVKGAGVNSDASLHVYSGATLTGFITMTDDADIYMQVGSILDFDLETCVSVNSGELIHEELPLVRDLSLVAGAPDYTMTIFGDGVIRDETYLLAKGAEDFIGTISVMDAGGTTYGSFGVGETIEVGGQYYTLNLNDSDLSVTLSGTAPGPDPGPGPEPPPPRPTVTAKSDIDGNGVSDVLFVWTGTEEQPGNYQHGYWMNGNSDNWQSAEARHPSDWDNLGCYDMTGDGRADSVMFGNVNEDGIKGAYIGYYTDGIDLDENWVTIGHLDNIEVEWHNAVGNLTGSGSAFDLTGAALPAATPPVNSIVWYAPEMYALGVWKEGKEDWVSISENFGGDAWTLVGCGDFDGDGRDSIMMAYNGGQLFYTADIDGTTAEMGDANWSGWEVRAIGDFKGDGKDDLVLFHKETGSMVMIADGRTDEGNYISLDQLSAKDWFVVGCGDYDGDQKDDLLVRQYSTGMLGYYASGDTKQWVELGRGVGMEWTVIA